MLSQPVGFEKLANTRDLGGMSAADGKKIKAGKLFRSGHISGASEKDLQKLSGLIELSVDFRTEQECSEKPEPAINGVEYQWIPILEEQRAGVSRDQDSFAEVRRNMLKDAKVGKKYMESTYESFICSDYSVSQYRKFVDLLLQSHEKGVLWHCTAGKDRAGFAAVIIQELLGVPREDIMEDYLLTNDRLKPEIRSLTEMLRNLPGVDPDNAAEAAFYLFGAIDDYLKNAYDAAEKKYGSFDNYLTEALHITPVEREKLREMYLE